MVFNPCQGKTRCRDDGERCLTCGRSLVEIRQLRELLDGLADLAVRYRYDNVDAFAAYVAYKVPKLISHRLTSADTAASPADEV